jgi:soluble lytic murein transglycosylase-like protein
LLLAWFIHLEDPQPCGSLALCVPADESDELEAALKAQRAQAALMEHAVADHQALALRHSMDFTWAAAAAKTVDELAQAIREPQRHKGPGAAFGRSQQMSVFRSQLPCKTKNHFFYFIVKKNINS